MISRLSVLLLALLFAPTVKAAELISFGENIRSLGMGGVRIPTGEEASVIFWNPAGLGYNSGLQLDLFDLNLGVNGLQNKETFESLEGREGFDLITPLYGKPVWLGINGYAAASLGSYGFGVFNEGSADLTVNNPAFPEVNARYYNDYGYSMGAGYNLQGLSFGVAARRITRRGGNKTIGADLLNDFNLETLQTMFDDEGVGYGVDAGVMFKAPAPMSPTFSLVWQNIGTTQFTRTKGLTTPEPIKDNVILGMNMFGDIGLVSLGLGAEYRHIGLQGEQLGKKIHMGAELSLMMMDFRAGFYQGYTTYGFGLDMFLFQLDAAMYSVERGAYPGQSPDQRVQVGLSAHFGFDPDFNLISFNGRGRKLKQRR